MSFRQALQNLITAIDDYYKVNEAAFDPTKVKEPGKWPAAYHEAKELLATAEEEDELGKPEINTN